MGDETDDFFRGSCCPSPFSESLISGACPVNEGGKAEAGDLIPFEGSSAVAWRGDCRPECPRRCASLALSIEGEESRAIILLFCLRMALEVAVSVTSLM